MEELEQLLAKRVNRGEPEPTLIKLEFRSVKASGVARKIKSFDHFIYFFDKKAGCYLPTKTYVELDLGFSDPFRKTNLSLIDRCWILASSTKVSRFGHSGCVEKIKRLKSTTQILS